MSANPEPQISSEDDSAHSLHRLVGAIVDEILDRLDRERPNEWNEWNSFAGQMVRCYEGRDRWKRRVISEVIETHCPNE